MKARKTVAGAGAADDEVAAFLVALQHPLKADIEAVRRIILGTSPAVADGIKWNSISFRATEFFATIHLRSIDRVQLVFHRGAKVRKDAPTMAIPDPAGLLKWLAPDRCLVTVGAGQAIAAHRAALETIVRAWLPYL